MWSCDCLEDGKFDARYFDLKPTTVDKYDVCTRCGNYAVWAKNDDMRKNRGILRDKSVTIFKLKEDKSKHFTDMYKASIYAGYTSKHALPRAFKDKTVYYSRSLGVLAILGNHSEVPDEYKKYTKPKKVYAFNYETGKLLAKGSLSYLSKKLDELETTIVSNLHRGTIKSRQGIVYSKNENFNVDGYKAAMEIPSEKDSVNWKHDVISYEDSELGVSYKEDTYGTWKDLLYS